MTGILLPGGGSFFVADFWAGFPGEGRSFFVRLRPGFFYMGQMQFTWKGDPTINGTNEITGA
jgi:hypothetical protein